MGLLSARKMKKDARRFKWSQKAFAKRATRKKFDPLKGSHQAKGIVVSKFQKEAKQPNSAMPNRLKMVSKWMTTMYHQFQIL